MSIANVLMFLVTVTIASWANAASFDCDKAATYVEKAICGNRQISKMDDQLAVSYQKALANSSNPDVIKSQHRDWLRSVRDRCQTVECLKDVYTIRLVELNDGPTFKPTPSSVSGEYKRVYYGKGNPDNDTAILFIRAQKDGRLHVTGDARYAVDPKIGRVYFGGAEGTFPLTENKLYYSGEPALDSDCKFTITFSVNSLTVSDDSGWCGGGMGQITFNGLYRKVRTFKSKSLKD